MAHLVGRAIAGRQGEGNVFCENRWDKKGSSTTLGTLKILWAKNNPGANIRSMPASANKTAMQPPIGIGYYTVPEAARLLRVKPRKISRWLGGYTYNNSGESIQMPPLWSSQIPHTGDGLELGFRDLIELRFIAAFTGVGLGLKAIRNCLDYARECVQDDRPFSTRRFRTDGKTIFLESLKNIDETELLDLKKRQYVIREVIERSFKDLDIEDD